MKTRSLFRSGFLLVALLSACSPAPQPVASPASTAAPTLTATVFPPTPTPVAYVGGSLPCFAGPHIDDNVVSIVEITDQPAILGADDSRQFYAIERKDGKGYCWIEAYYVTTDARMEDLAKIRPTATPRPPKPQSPTLIESKFTCYMFAYPRRVDARIQWEPVPGAEGYRVLLDGKVLAELDPDETEFSGTMRDHLFGSANGLVTYVIEAYNPSGSSSLKVPIRYFCNQ